MNKLILLIMLLLISAISGCNNYADKKTSNNIINGTASSDYTKQTSDEKPYIPNKNSYIYPEVQDWLKSVDFLSSKEGFLSLVNTSSKNILMKTVDCGCSWQIVNSCDDLYSLCFITSKIGYAIVNLGDGEDRQPALANTRNGGVDWELVPFVDGKIPVEINIIDENTIFIGASTSANGLLGGLKYEDSIFFSKDGAKTWEVLNVPKEFIGEGMSWISAAEGYVISTSQPVAGMQPKILHHTLDRGKTWSIVAESQKLREHQNQNYPLPLAGYPDGIKFFKDGTGYIGIMKAPILKTIDTGKTFKYVTLPEGEDSHPVPDFINKDEGFAIFGNRELIHTVNGGGNWEKIWP